MQDALLRLRYRYWPDHLLGEILSKRWTETAIPVIVLLIITILLSRSIPGFLSAGGLADTFGDHLGTNRIGADEAVGPVLLGRADRHDDALGGAEIGFDLFPGLEMEQHRMSLFAGAAAP